MFRFSTMPYGADMTAQGQPMQRGASMQTVAQPQPATPPGEMPGRGQPMQGGPFGGWQVRPAQSGIANPFIQGIMQGKKWWEMGPMRMQQGNALAPAQPQPAVPGGYSQNALARGWRG